MAQQGVPAHCELTAPEKLGLGAELPDDAGIEILADAISVSAHDIVTDAHAPRMASVGPPFLLVEVGGLSALSRCRIRPDAWRRVCERIDCNAVHIYTRQTGPEDGDASCRMFASLGGIKADPATGSANCALAGLLASLEPGSDGTFCYNIVQGVDMGRPSELRASVEKRRNEIATVRIGGSSVDVTEGWLTV